MRSRQLRSMGVGLVLVVAMGTVPAPSQEAPLPNLVPWPTDTVFMGAEAEGRVLMVELVAENVGSHPLALRGEPRPDSGADGFQCIGWEGALCSSWTPAGTMAFRRQTGCWAFEQLARYELRVLVEGAPDPSAAGLVARTIPANGFSDDVRDAAGSGTQLPSYPACLGFLRQGLSPGWVTRFEGDEAGHAIPLGGVANGVYALVVAIDPAGLIHELDEEDNTTWTTVEITGDEVKIL